MLPVALFILALIWLRYIAPLLKAIRLGKKALGIKKWKDLEDKFESGPRLPDTACVLTQLKKMEWKHEEPLARRLAELEKLEFENCGIFSGFPGFDAFILLLRGDGLAVMVGEAQDVSVCEILGIQESGMPLTVSDRICASVDFLLPGEISFQWPSETLPRLFEEFAKARVDAGLVVLKKEDIIYRLEEIEIKRAFYLAGHTELLEHWYPDDPEHAEVTRWLSQSVADLVTSCCRLQYAQQSGLTAREWERIKDRLFFAHDFGKFSQFPNDFVDESKNLAEFHKSMSNTDKPMNRADFAVKNSKLLESLRLIPIAKLDDPVSADVYLSFGLRCGGN